MANLWFGTNIFSAMTEVKTRLFSRMSKNLPTNNVSYFIIKTVTRKLDEHVFRNWKNSVSYSHRHNLNICINLWYEKIIVKPTIIDVSNFQIKSQSEDFMISKPSSTAFIFGANFTGKQWTKFSFLIVI